MNVLAIQSLAAELSRPADYIARFVQYVHWRSEEGIQRWQICVAGDVASVRADYADLLARGKPFEVRAVQASDDLGSCQVLDLTSIGSAAIPGYLDAVREKPVLTVGSGSAFCSAGGLICLAPAGSPSAFEVNLSAVKRSGLLISAKLLSLGSKPLSRSPHP